jgi:uncharacterized protein
MPQKSTRLAAIAAVAGLMAAVTPAPLAAQPVNLTIGSFGQGSGWYVYAVNLAEVLRGVLPSGSRIDTPPIAGGVGNPGWWRKARPNWPSEWRSWATGR